MALTNVTGALKITGPLKETEGTLGLAPAVPEAVLDAEPVTVVAAGGVKSGGKPIPSPMESTSKDSETTSMGSANRDLSDRFRETSFSVTVSYIPLNLSK